MIDLDALVSRLERWQNRHPPNTGQSIRQWRSVCEAAKAGRLPKGTNLLLQICAQMTGVEESFDLIGEYPETRLAYSNLDRWSFDKSMDCSSFVEAMYQVWWQKSLGSWSEEQWENTRHLAIPWSERRAFDVAFWNFKADQGRRVSHVGLIVTKGLLCHTTSPKNPLRIEADTYASYARVAVVRPLADAQYQSIFVDTEGDDMLSYGDRSDQVKLLQQLLVGLGYNLGAYGPNHDGVDGVFGALTKAAVQKFQSDYSVQASVPGAADDATLLAMALVYSERATSTQELETLRQTVAAQKGVLGEIARLVSPYV